MAILALIIQAVSNWLRDIVADLLGRLIGAVVNRRCRKGGRRSQEPRTKPKRPYS